MKFDHSPPPKVTLVGYSSSTIINHGVDANLGPLQVIAVIWKQSKTTQPLDEIIDEVKNMDDDALSTLMESVLSGVPVVEAVSFNFIIENASISWREQMVRHRVGTKADNRVGVDWQMIDVQDIGDVADMSAWSQSMRLMDMSTFAERKAYRTPDTVIEMGDEAIRRWHSDMKTIEKLYSSWATLGLPLEDARDLIPLGATSRLSWTLNLRTLQHIVGKRGCTILQLGLWGSVILGIIEELSTKIHPVFTRLVTPPCLNGNKYTGCIFPEDIQRRYDGRDWNLPVCPLFIGLDKGELGNKARKDMADGTIRNKDMILAEASKRSKFWGRNAWNGLPQRYSDDNGIPFMTVPDDNLTRYRQIRDRIQLHGRDSLSYSDREFLSEWTEIQTKKINQ